MLKLWGYGEVLKFWSSKVLKLLVGRERWGWGWGSSFVWGDVILEALQQLVGFLADGLFELIKPILDDTPYEL